MKKKIYDEFAGSFVHAILNNLEGSESVYADYSLNLGRVDRVIKYIYHVSPEEVTVCCYSKFNHHPFINEYYCGDEIWLHGAEQAIGELEKRILENIHQYCEDPLKYVEKVIKKNRKE